MKHVLIPVKAYSLNDFLRRGPKLVQHSADLLTTRCRRNRSRSTTCHVDAALEDYHESIEAIHVVRVDLIQIIHEEEKQSSPCRYRAVLLGHKVDRDLSLL